MFLLDMAVDQRLNMKEREKIEKPKHFFEILEFCILAHTILQLEKIN